MAMAMAMVALVVTTGIQAGEPQVTPTFAPPRVVIRGLAQPESGSSIKTTVIKTPVIKTPVIKAEEIKAAVSPPARRDLDSSLVLPAKEAVEVPRPVLPTPQPTPQPAVARVSQSSSKPSEGRDVSDPKKLRKITSIRPFQDYSPLGQPPVNRKPEELKLGEGDFPARVFESQVFRWKPSDLYHFPLYFEDPALERYGHTHHELLQPFVSAHRFGTQLIGLPYQMTIDPILKKTYSLGWYRPGEPAPKLLYQVPWNAEAAAAQAGVMTGLFFLVP
tara:strand:+ start:92 stop:916 length:825 start_codon:yes stop_codon:yes gene_type:complete